MSWSGNEAISMQIFKPLVAIVWPFLPPYGPPPSPSLSEPKRRLSKFGAGGKANGQVIYFLLPTAASPSFLSLFEAQIIIVAINGIARGNLSSSTAVNPNRPSIKRPVNRKKGADRTMDGAVATDIVFHVGPLFDLLRQNGNIIAVVSE
jgi:hypothetical protein